MKLARPLVVALAAVTVAAAASATLAETFSLALKRLDQQDISRSYYLYWAYPQHFFFQTIADGNVRMVNPQNSEQAAAFKRIVKKEPKYITAHPFRGVVKLGGQEYAFVLDASPPKEEPKLKPGKEKPPAAAKAAQAKSVWAQQIGAALGTPTAPAESRSKAPRYNRLYFDLNHNGDLTDDKPIDAETTPGGVVMPADYSPLQFPRVDLTLDVDGTKVEYSFLMSGYVNTSPRFSFVQLRLTAAACREGDITLEGRKHHVVLVDFNSNGRFDDEIKIKKDDMVAADGRIFPEQGDMLLIDPRSAGGSPIDVAGSAYRHNVSKLVNLDGRFYELKVSPAGDKLTLTPSTTALGKVTNPNGAFQAVVYGDQGFVKISGSKESPAVVPEGRWKLLSYSLTCKQPPKPREKDASAAAEKTAQPPTANSTWGAVANLLLGSADASGGRTGGAEAVVQAEATTAYKPITVRKDQTVEMPFGPPYKPVVTAFPGFNGPWEIVNGKPVQKKTASVLQMSLSLVGSGGEVCSDMRVDGNRPSKPEFTISDSKGKVVQRGSFEYG